MERVRPVEAADRGHMGHHSPRPAPRVQMKTGRLEGPGRGRLRCEVQADLVRRARCGGHHGATDAQIAAAGRALEERIQKLERARRTRAERLDPTVCAYLDEVFARLELIDPKRYVRDVIAGYPRDAIVDGIATYEAKQRRGTLPEGADARYLLGIVRNLHHTHEADAIREALLRELGASASPSVILLLLLKPFVGQIWRRCFKSSVLVSCWNSFAVLQRCMATMA